MAVTSECFDKKGFHRLTCLSIWSPVGEGHGTFKRMSLAEENISLGTGVEIVYSSNRCFYSLLPVPVITATINSILPEL